MTVEPVTLGEGTTPLIPLPALAQRWGIGALWAKMEHLNPTGSYKDRIAAASMTAALRHGRAGWIATSSGNGGAAMSAYGTRAGLPGILCVQSDAPAEKLASILPYGVPMIPMASLGPDVMAGLADIAEQQNLMLTITTHAHNPEGMRGADAIGAEMAIAGRGITHVYVPSGGGGLVTATARGLVDGGSTAAVIVAQPAGCAPIARFVEGELDAPIVPTCDTAVSGLQLPSPPDGAVAAAAVRASRGWGTTVTDAAAWRAQDELATAEGIFVEPAAAVAMAAVAADAAAGRLGPEDHAAVVLTGSGLKDLRRFNLSLSADDVVAFHDLAKRVRTYLGKRG